MWPVSNLTFGILLFSGMLGLMAVRVPISISMFIPGAVGYIAYSGWDHYLNFVKGMGYARFSIYDLSVIPLFLLMGSFATQSNLSKSVFGFANGLLGRFKGGMAMASVLACAAFGSICGSSVATTATVAQVAYPEMRRLKYSGRLATAVLAAGGALGILLPPSVTLVVYAILTEQNITKLFAAAYIPGAIAAIGYMIAVAIYVRLFPGHAPEQTQPSREEFIESSKNVWPILVIFFTVFGGIYGGLFTPTEGAAIGTVCTFILAVTKGGLTFPGFKNSLLNTAKTCGMIFMIFLGADMMNASLALSQMPNALAAAVASAGYPPLVIMTGIMIFYVILGCVMDELSMIMLTIPVLFPVVMGLDFYGLNPSDKAIWFGMLILMVVEIGMIFPPVGLTVYIMNSLAKDVPMTETYLGVVPFLMSDAVRMALLMLFPSISLFLVHLMH
jgi:tripartite ATP-independent transporter DctM subunit